MLTSSIDAARGCRTRRTGVSPSPSKIPYGGFSPVRLQTRNSRRDLRRPTGRLIRNASSDPCPLWPRRAWVQLGGGRSPGRSRPEVLGSPAGYVVLPGHGLLPPHVPLSTPLAGLFPSPRRVSSSRPFGQAGIERFPNLLCLCYGPEESLALHRPGRLGSSFHLLSRLPKASNITTRVNQPIPATGLAPARQAALWAANRGHRGRGERRSAFLSDLCDLCGRSFLRGKRKS
jgi:hypothetical protein